MSRSPRITVPAPQRRRVARDLTRATWLRPWDVRELYGIPQSTLCHYATKLPMERRPESHFIPGRGGRKGIRLFPRGAFEAWLRRWTADGKFTAPA